MSLKTLPSTLEEAHALIEQLQWRVPEQLRQQLFARLSPGNRPDTADR